MASVQEIVELPADKAVPKRSGDFLDIRGRFVPFLRLRSLFEGVGEAPTEQNVVIVMSGENRVGIVVDRIVGTNQTVIKQMSKLHAGVRAVSGATILGDGSVALILDVAHLVSMGRVPEAAAQYGKARSVAPSNVEAIWRNGSFHARIGHMEQALALVAVNPDTTGFPVTRQNGVLASVVFPSGGLLPGRTRSSFAFEPHWRSRPWPPRNKYEHSASDAELGLLK